MLPLLHEIFPSGPIVPVAFIVLGLVFVTPLYLIRRKYGGTSLALATTAEVIIAGVVVSSVGALIPTAFGGAAAALILHGRALRRPDGYAFVDIGLSIAGFWFTVVMFGIVSAVALR